MITVLRSMRTEKKLTQRAVAEEAAVDYYRYRKIENDGVSADRWEMNNLALFFGVTVDTLFHEIHNMAKLKRGDLK